MQRSPQNVRFVTVIQLFHEISRAVLDGQVEYDWSRSHLCRCDFIDALCTIAESDTRGTILTRLHERVVGELQGFAEFAPDDWSQRVHELDYLYYEWESLTLRDILDVYLPCCKRIRRIVDNYVLV